MKVSREKAVENRETVVKIASKLFREHGFNGINVPDLMAGAGLTHGGFYRQFESKEALLGEAAESALEEATAFYEKITSKPDGKSLWGKGYLAEKHKYACPVVNLAADVSRQLPHVQKRFAAGLRKFLGVTKAEVGTKEWERHTAAIATIFGTLLMAKAVREADKDLADAITDAGLKQFEILQ